MSIKLINIDEFKQDFEVSQKNKSFYGEVRTDFKLIDKMLNLIPQSLFYLPHKKWLDPCCGNGYFMMCLYKKLFFTLSESFPDEDERHCHIVSNMLYMIEINNEHIDTLYDMFGKNANIICDDFLNYDANSLNIDIIIANPPYNFPNKSSAIWNNFMTKFVHTLDDYGHLLIIIPSLWLKKSHLSNSFINQFHISSLHTMSSSETNKIFHYKAQTATTFFHLQKKPSDNFIKIFDNSLKQYVQYNTKFTIPMKNQYFMSKFKSFVGNNYIKVEKTNLDIGFRNKTTQFSSVKSDIYKYKNIHTCILPKNKPILKINFSNNPCCYYGKPKIILAHKMYGLPYYDKEGVYGIPTKDNYVIINKTHDEFFKIEKIFNSKCIRLIFNSFRFRMATIEKEAFEFIPNLSLLNRIDWDFFDSSLLTHIKADLALYEIMTKCDIHTNIFKKIFI